ncbi:MFS transporter [Actinoplanes sp. CA-030573]|uniref:MFS transporter n=1 Tax=Actinoplanes sp. CA-030573 TaxID=3239898 RepID=UPI003D94522C
MLVSWRPLSGLLVAQTGALTANRILLVALPWLVLTATGSPARTGLVAFCQVLPFVVVQALTGPILDRVRPRLVSTAGDLTSAAAIAALALPGERPLWVLMAVAALIGAADGPATAAKGMLLPSATARAGQPLERGAGLATAAERTATAAGPALAGLLIAGYGVPAALWSAVGALLAAAAVLPAVAAGPTGRLSRTGVSPREVPPAGDAYLARLRHGAEFLRGDTSLRAIVTMIVITNFADQAFLTVLLPVWARGTGHGAALVGLAISGFATASIGTALLAAWIGHRLPRRVTYLVGFVISGVSRIVALAAGLPPDVVLIIFTVAGLGSGLVNPIISTLTYERIPPELLGRVQTLITACAWSGIPFGGLAGAAILAGAGLTTSLWCCSAGYLLAVLRPGWRVEWHPPASPAPPITPPAPAGDPPGRETRRAAPVRREIRGRYGRHEPALVRSEE